jgi:hypothetical protein
MKTIQRGEEIPVGLSRWQDPAGHGLQFRLPIFIKHGLFYNLNWDAMHTGWQVLNILIRTEYHGFNFRWGWRLLKETAPAITRDGQPISWNV